MAKEKYSFIELVFYGVLVVISAGGIYHLFPSYKCSYMTTQKACFFVIGGE